MGEMAIGCGDKGTMQAWWFLEDMFNKSALTLLVNRKEPYQALSHMDSKAKSFAILLQLCFTALPPKMFVDLLKCAQQRTSPTRLKVCTYMAKKVLEPLSYYC